MLVSTLIIYLLQGFEKYLPVGSFLYAFELHFILMAWYAFSLNVLKLDYKSSYYNSASIENNGKIYVYFGVNIFRWFLKRIGWNKISDKSNGYVTKDLNRLKKREKHTREAELAHAILFVHFILISLYFVQSYNVIWLMVLNIILHAFPVFIQRYNRPRYLKVNFNIRSKKE